MQQHSERAHGRVAPHIRSLDKGKTLPFLNLQVQWGEASPARSLAVKVKTGKKNAAQTNSEKRTTISTAACRGVFKEKVRGSLVALLSVRRSTHDSTGIVAVLSEMATAATLSRFALQIHVAGKLLLAKTLRTDTPTHFL